MITVMIIDCESLALETGNTTKCMSCVPTFHLQAISNKQQPMSNEQQAMTHRLSVLPFSLQYYFIIIASNGRDVQFAPFEIND